LYFHAVSESKSIKNWLEDERPREKMQQKGASALTDAELLAILISSGTPKRSALDLARDVLGLANNQLRDIGRLSVTELQKVKGIGVARAITISAALELGRRRQLSENPDRQSVSNTAVAARMVMPHLQDLSHEVFYVLYLNHNNKLLREEKISSGGYTQTTVDVRMILKSCLLHNASRIIIAHNHPSGSKKPSESDLRLTGQIKEAARLMEIQLIDHIIVAGSEYLSMANEGLI
jgi:DNA repair protein RadC